jgi:Tol biopolymer transport system component
VVVTVLLLAACGGSDLQPAPQLPTAPPVTATAAPEGTSTPLARAVAASPTPAPPTATAAPTLAAEGLLPAPLYFLRDGQIWRLERDGAALNQMTSVQDGAFISAFDVSSRDGTLVYAAAEPSEDSYPLYLTDSSGASLTVLVEDPAFLLNTPLWSPDGSQIAYQRLSRNPADTEHRGGVYVVSRDGGDPQPVQANEPLQDLEEMTLPSARTYVPLAWAPDGTRLLLEDAAFEVSSLAVKPLGDEALIPLLRPDGTPLPCCDASWSPDSTAVYVASTGRLPLGFTAPGLWRADAETGNSTLLVAGEAGGQYAPTAFPRAFADGELYFFATSVAQPPATSEPGPVPLTVHRMSLDDRLPEGTDLPGAMRSETYQIAEALWAPDGSGVVVLTSSSDAQDAELLWIPTDGTQPVRQLPISGGNLRWGLTEPE